MKSIILKLFLLIAVISAVLAFASCADPDAGSKNAFEADDTSAKDTVGEAKLIEEISEMNEYLKFAGRTYTKDQTVYFNWSYSGFEFNFYGTKAEALIVTNLGYNGTSLANNGMLWVCIDGDTEGKKLIELDERSKWYTLAEGLEDGLHNIRVIKRTQVGYSTAGLEKLRIDGEFAEKPAEKKLKIEVIGDSFSCGDGCYTVGGRDAYVSLNQDSYVSYGKLVAEHFDAELNIVARCGMGLVWNHAGKTAEEGVPSLPQIYEYTDYFNNGTEEAWDFSKFDADIIILNIGTNDSSYISRNTSLWVSTYVEFLKTLRKNNPDAAIICTQGASNCNSGNMAFDSIKRKAEYGGVDNLYFYTMLRDYDPEVDGMGVGMHPSPATHRKTADQLIAEINRLGLIK